MTSHDNLVSMTRTRKTPPTVRAKPVRRFKGKRSGDALIAAMQASPCRDIDIEPKRDREALGIGDFTKADVEAIRRTRPSPESAAFDHELKAAPRLRALMNRKLPGVKET
jgi:hypothetical protein